jgi:predicted ribosome quality control (RQC) complex YloA/Tae2 family protein
MSTTTCPAIPDYQTLRKENLAKIQTYYSELLNDYSGLGGSDMTAAQPLVNSYNTQLNTAAKELVDNLNKTIDLVAEQQKNLDENNSLVVANRQRIQQLKKDIKSAAAQNEARHKNSIDTINRTKELGYWHTGYLIINILLLLAAVGIIIWLFMAPN